MRMFMYWPAPVTIHEIQFLSLEQNFPSLRVRSVHKILSEKNLHVEIALISD